MKSIMIIFLLAFYSLSVAQETPQKAATPEPIDLPNFIIQGNLQLNVNSGVKQSPERPKPLSAGELDSLNSLEKQSSQSLPIEPLITNTIDRNTKDGFVKAQFGRFSTAQIDAAYGAKLENYDLYGKIGYEFSEGHITNADFSKFNAKITSDYIAPTKFFIFGGSRTRTEIEFSKNSFNLYGSTLGLERAMNNFSAKVDVDGNYNGFKFETGAGFNGFQVVTDNFKNADNNILGYLKVHNNWNNFLVAGNLLLDMHNFRGQATNFIQADASLSVFSDVLSITGNGGLQLATNVGGIDRGGLLLAAKLEYRMNKLFTVRADVRSGLENRSFKNMAIENPYISNMTDFDFAYDIMNLSANLIFHPNEYLGVSAGIRIRSTDRYPVFAPDITYYSGSFGIDYESISLVSSMFEAYWYLSDKDKLTANMLLTSSSLSDFDNSKIPYMPDIKISLQYDKTWFAEFGTNFGIDYVGNRFADLQNTVELDSYINLRAEGYYKIYDGLRAFLRFDNLLNSDIYVWENYRERNVFVSFGVMWQF